MFTAHYPDGFTVTTDAAGAIAHLEAGAIITGPDFTPDPEALAAAADALELATY